MDFSHLREKRKNDSDDRSDDSSEPRKQFKNIKEDENDGKSQKSAVDLVREIIAKSAAKAKMQQNEDEVSNKSANVDYF